MNDLPTVGQNPCRTIVQKPWFPIRFPNVNTKKRSGFKTMASFRGAKGFLSLGTLQDGKGLLFWFRVSSTDGQLEINGFQKQHSDDRKQV